MSTHNVPFFNTKKKNTQNGVYSKRKEFAHILANSFLLELTPIKNGGKIENG